MKLSIWIIIIHFGKLKTTLNCLDSLHKIKWESFPNIIIVNNSTKISLEKSFKTYHLVRHVITPNYNLGFSKANNLGIVYAKNSHASHILLLNNDTLIYTDFIASLNKNSPADSISAPVIEHLTKQGARYDYGGSLKLLTGITIHDNRSVYDPDIHLISKDYVSGCCMFIPISVINKVGFLDENFFMYLEDVDYCFKAKKAGINTYIIPAANLFHLGSQSASTMLQLKQGLKNSLTIAKRYIPFPYFFSCNHLLKSLLLSFND